MILVQLAQLAAAIEIQGRIADRDPPQPVLHQAGHHQRGAHAFGLRVGPAVLAQRVIAMALGYEDLNDHDRMRHDPLLKVTAAPRSRIAGGAPLPALAAPELANVSASARAP